jgi:hypothetical protein
MYFFLQSCLVPADFGGIALGVHILRFQQSNGVSCRSEHPHSGLPEERGQSRGLCISETSGLPRLRLFLVHDASAGIGAVTRC